MKKKYGLFLAMCLLLTGCGAQQQTAEAPVLLDPVAVQADTATVIRGDLSSIETMDGAIVPEAIELSFEIDGKLNTVDVYPGKWVEEGEELFSLDQTDLGKQMQSLKKQMDELQQNGIYDDACIELNIQILQLELEQLRSSSDNGEGEGEGNNDGEGEGNNDGEGSSDAIAIAIAEKEWEIKQEELNLQQAQELRASSLEALKADWSELAKNYGKNVITAPCSGHLIYENLLYEGTSVQAEKPIAYVVNPENLMLKVSKYISESTFVGKECYAYIGDSRYALEPVPMDTTEYVTRSLAGKEVYTQFKLLGTPEELAEIQAGMYALVCFEHSISENALLVPTGALYIGTSAEKYMYVYVQTEDGGREHRVVKVGRNNGIMTEITEGLKEGEIVYVKE